MNNFPVLIYYSPNYQEVDSSSLTSRGIGSTTPATTPVPVVTTPVDYSPLISLLCNNFQRMQDTLNKTFEQNTKLYQEMQKFNHENRRQSRASSQPAAGSSRQQFSQSVAPSQLHPRQTYTGEPAPSIAGSSRQPYASSIPRRTIPRARAQIEKDPNRTNFLVSHA
jgi:hypothetical protein